ncbi:hypothetical protein WUBG_06856 [Wuchereria bancrofti]|uniref:Uncharacterized protein n=1 Tax=Wuchereria bancrofti TaxID=6293 RepID=J9EJ85_WUCBA|nr:hypothetical protein WUBG_06856 [Wuchereria bancrofti]
MELMKDQTTANEYSTKANSITLMVTIVFSLLLHVTSANRCNWIAGTPFNIPQKWNCNDQFTQNYTITEADVYTKNSCKYTSNIMQ